MNHSAHVDALGPALSLSHLLIHTVIYASSVFIPIETDLRLSINNRGEDAVYFIPQPNGGSIGLSYGVVQVPVSERGTQPLDPSPQTSNSS